MKITRLLILSLTVALGSLVASAQQVAAEAFVSSVVGSATVTLPGSSKALPVVAGQKLPEGAAIKTADGSNVTIQSHEGIQTGLGANTSASVGVHSVSAEGVRTAVIDLKQGTTVSVLDPAKRAVNNYAVRTPKGVAAARGTTYSTTVKLSSGGDVIVRVNTVTGEVSFSIGSTAITVSAGNSASSNRGVSTSIADAINEASPEEKAAIAEALKVTVIVVAALDQVGTNAVGGPTQPLLNTVVANVTKAANGVEDTELAKDIVTSTIDSVQTYAGPGSQSAVNAAVNNASNALRDTAQAAKETPATPVQVVASPTPNPNPTPTPTSTAPTITIPTPDVTIIVSPSS